jgi:2,4-dienoyl-CoA reductase-like NADH-dependent reductase (Old Yellow Enzyme family)
MHLFAPLAIRDVTLKNRIFVSPMCQYSCEEGLANDWHFVHLGSRAVGGAALVMAEATAVEAIGRISPEDLGIWDDRHVEPLARIARFIRAQGAVPAIQLAHAGRKASTPRPWDPRHGTLPAEQGGWQPVGPSAVAFAEDYAVPEPLDDAGILRIVGAFAAAARRALAAGFEIVEIHAAHGYLLHEFLSPLSNRRDDGYGGSLVHRSRLLVEVVQAVRRVWPERLPLFIRISATDWVPGGWGIEESVELSRRLPGLGIDVIDVSSGGTAPRAQVPLGPGYQTGFAERIRREAGVTVATVGLITSAIQADHIVRTGQADLVVLARAMLRNPYWALAAAAELGQEIAWPPPYLRAAPPRR